MNTAAAPGAARYVLVVLQAAEAKKVSVLVNLGEGTPQIFTVRSSVKCPHTETIAAVSRF
jgi:hypothetical protein